MIDLVICAAPDRRKSPGSRLDRRPGEDGTMSRACIKAETAVPCRQLTDLLSLSHGRTMGRRTYEYLSHYGSFHFYSITVKSTFQHPFSKKQGFFMNYFLFAAAVFLFLCTKKHHRISPMVFSIRIAKEAQPLRRWTRRFFSLGFSKCLRLRSSLRVPSLSSFFFRRRRARSMGSPFFRRTSVASIVFHPPSMQLQNSYSSFFFRLYSLVKLASSASRARSLVSA